jgi:lipopolysaccharide export LptBFGC system permease protein LptF
MMPYALLLAGLSLLTLTFPFLLLSLCIAYNVLLWTCPWTQYKYQALLC